LHFFVVNSLAKGNNFVLMAKIAEIYAYGEVDNVAADMADMFGVVSLDSIRKQLNNAGEFDSVRVHIHSRGGSVSEGFAIHDYIKSLGKPVETIIEGLCASIATVIALAGETRLMTPNSEFFIHNPWTEAGGDAAKFTEVAQMLTENENKLADFYAAKTGQAADSLKQLMAVETTLTPGKALELGFITAIAEPIKAYAKIDLQPKRKVEIIMETKKRSILDKLKALINDEPKALHSALENGTELYIETEDSYPKVGDMVYVGSDNTGEVPENAEHALTGDLSGYRIVTEGGKITEVYAPSEYTMAEMQAKVADLEAQLSAYQSDEAEVATALETATATIEEQAAEIVALKAKVQSDYTPKARQKEVLNRAKTTEDTNRIESAKERKADYVKIKKQTSNS
jgi:ATP-dependent protease ClpP protease subunit